jgi:hypothetical protein
MQAYKPNVITTKYGLKSFRHEAPRIWNRLPNEIRQTGKYRLFVGLLQTLENPLNNCSICR